MSAPVVPPMSDLAYAVCWCMRPIAEVAKITGTTPTKIMQELKREFEANPGLRELLPSSR